jgi:hypothetical protein
VQKRDKLKGKKNVKPDPGEPEFGNEGDLLFLNDLVIEKVLHAVLTHEESNAGVLL